MFDSFGVLKAKMGLLGWDDGKDYVLLSRHALKDLFQSYAAFLAESLDEAWYLETYPDVKPVLASGELQDAKEHYIKFGFFEDRIPYPFDFDADTYLELNPDVKSVLGDLTGKKLHNAARKHYIEHGIKEGRQIRE